MKRGLWAPFLVVAMLLPFLRGETAMLSLYDAIVAGSQRDLEMALSSGANPNAQCGPWPGASALHAACLLSRHTLVPTLIQGGAVVDARDRVGQTALMIAAGRGDLASVRALLDAGGDPNTRANDGSTALMRACERQAADVVTVLLASGADRTIRDAGGRTAREFATRASARVMLTDSAGSVTAAASVWYKDRDTTVARLLE